MSNFLRAKRLLFLLLTVLTILSCSWGNNKNEKQLTGRAVAGDALVWLDLNANLSPDPDEPKSRTNLTGDYSLLLPRDLSTAGLAIVVSVETGTSKTSDNRIAPTSYLLVAPASASNVSIWTTLVTALVLSEDASNQADGQARVRTAFELPGDFDFSLEMTNKVQALAGLTQIVENAYGQKSAKSTLLPAAEPRGAMIAAAREVIGLSPQLLDIVKTRSLLTAPPLLTGSRPLEAGVFYGDFTAIPINTNMAYGIGLDESNYNLKEVCIDTNAQYFDGLCSNDYTYTFDLVESVDELSKKMEIGAAAKAGVSVAGFDVVSVSGGFKYLSENRLAKNTLWIIFRVEQKLCGYPATPVLTAGYALKFSNNYEEFRKTCGDRYLSSITSGGMFTALIEVKADENTEIKDLRLSLSGKMLGATVFNKTWKETLSDIDKDYTTHTYVLSNNSYYSKDLLSMPQVFDLYDEFAAKMKTPECSGANGWKDCGYLATFFTYDTISNTPPGNAATVRTNLANMQALEGYYFESADLLTDISEILLYPDDYNIGDSVDAFNKPNAWTLDKLREQQDQISDYQLLVTGQWSTCKTNIQNCSKSTEDLALPSWLELKQALPTRKFIFPESCDILSAQFGVTGDGEHWLFLGGDVSKSYRVYCQDMATSMPKTFLKLFNSSANVTAPSYNYSSLHYETNDGSKGMITRTFAGLQVEPRTDPTYGDHYLRILPGQSDYTNWAASPVIAGESQPLLAKTLDILEAQGQGGATATANLNLDGTPLILSPSPNVKGGGAFTELLYPISLDQKNIDLTVVGGTAWVEGDIRLEWNKSVY